MYQYKISSGALRLNGVLVGFGWSGQSPHMNDPAATNIPNVGPLPIGRYLIGRAYTHPLLGPVVMNLTPDAANEMYGRADFRIHGASAAHPSLSSHGCIILPRPIRIRIDMDTVKVLEVIEC